MSFVKIENPKQRDKMFKELEARKQAIKERFRSERLGEQAIFEDMSKVLKPVIDPSKQIKEILEKQQPYIEHTYNEQYRLRKLKEKEQSPQAIRTGYEQAFTHAAKRPRIEPAPTTVTVARTPAEKLRNITDKSGLAIKPIDGQANKYSIGNSELTFESDDIYVDGVKKYKTTNGLMELLTQSNPQEFNEDDKNNYLLLIKHSKAYLQDPADSNSRPLSSGAYKWKYIIRPWYISEKKGSGIFFLPSDPNALFEKLALLIRSKSAGNTGVYNEMYAILDELLRQKVITKKKYVNVVKNIFKR